MAKFKRSVTIEFDVTDDQEYCDIANLLWHVMEMSRVPDFHAVHDGKNTPAMLNDAWADLDSGPHW